MFLLAFGLIVFFLPHLFTAFARGWRSRLVDGLGEGAYKGLYSVVALVGFVLIIVGWRSADATVLYSTPGFLRHVAYPLMAIALILLAAAYVPAGRIAAVVKHPMLAGVKIWAFAHLLVNGELRSVLLFGCFLAYAVVDRVAVKRRGESGRTAGGIVNDGVAVAVGLAAYLAIYLYLHRFLAGVPLS